MKSEPGSVGTIFEVRRTVPQSYDARFTNANGVTAFFVVEQSDLMPADGRSYAAADAVKLRDDVPSRGLTSGTVGTVLNATSGGKRITNRF